MQCQPGEYFVDTDPPRSGPGSCKPCGPNSFLSEAMHAINDGNQPGSNRVNGRPDSKKRYNKCRDQPTCAAGERISEDSKVQQRECFPCPKGTFRSSGGHREEICDTCASGSKFTDEFGSKSCRDCRGRCDPAAGKSEVQPCAPASDRVCRDIWIPTLALNGRPEEMKVTATGTFNRQQLPVNAPDISPIQMLVPPWTPGTFAIGSKAGDPVTAGDHGGDTVRIIRSSPTPGLVADEPGYPLDLSMIGKHTIVYNAVDAAGNRAAPVTRTVVIEDKPNRSVRGITLPSCAYPFVRVHQTARGPLVA